MIRLLSKDEAQTKCHIGERARCCVFLVVGDGGLECAYVEPVMRLVLADRRATGQTNARSGPCEDPMDATSEAVEYAPAQPHRCIRACFAALPSEHVDRYGFMPRMEDLGRPPD